MLMRVDLEDLVEIVNRIQQLEKRVEKLELQVAENNKKDITFVGRPAFPAEKVSKKYKRLAEYLYEKWERRIELSYSEIEKIIGFALPPTAYNLPQSFWANTLTHSYATGWMAVLYRAKVNSEMKLVMFERTIY